MRSARQRKMRVVKEKVIVVFFVGAASGLVLLLFVLPNLLFNQW